MLSLVYGVFSNRETEILQLRLDLSGGGVRLDAAGGGEGRGGRRAGPGRGRGEAELDVGHTAAGLEEAGVDGVRWPRPQQLGLQCQSCFRRPAPFARPRRAKQPRLH